MQAEIHQRQKHMGSTSCVSPSPSPKGGRAASGGVPTRRPLMLLAERTVTGEVLPRGSSGKGTRGGGGGDPYSVINTALRRGSTPPRRSPSSSAGQTALRAVEAVLRPTAAGRGSGGPGGCGSSSDPQSSATKRAPPASRSMAAAVADAQAAVQLEAATSAAAAAISRGSSPVNFRTEAEELAMSFPPYVIVMPPNAHGDSREPSPTRHSSSQQNPVAAAAARDQGWSDTLGGTGEVRRDTFLPPPGLVASSAPTGGWPRLAPWELERQLQESLRK